MPSHYCTKTSQYKMLLAYKNNNVGLDPKQGDKANYHTYYSFHCYDKKGIGKKKLLEHFNSVSDKVLQMRLIENRGSKPCILGVDNGALLSPEEIEKFNLKSQENR
jgi:hypothetical protein